MTPAPAMKPLLQFALRLGRIMLVMSVVYLCLLAIGWAGATALPSGHGDLLLQEIDKRGWMFILMVLVLAVMERICTWMLGKFPPDEVAREAGSNR